MVDFSEIPSQDYHIDPTPEFGVLIPMMVLCATVSPLELCNVIVFRRHLPSRASVETHPKASIVFHDDLANRSNFDS